MLVSHSKCDFLENAENNRIQKNAKQKKYIRNSGHP